MTTTLTKEETIKGFGNFTVTNTGAVYSLETYILYANGYKKLYKPKREITGSAGNQVYLGA